VGGANKICSLVIFQMTKPEPVVIWQ